VSIPGTDSEALLMHLRSRGDRLLLGLRLLHRRGRAVAVLTAMGVPRELGVAALRFSFGKESTLEDVEATCRGSPEDASGRCER